MTPEELEASFARTNPRLSPVASVDPVRDAEESDEIPQPIPEYDTTPLLILERDNYDEGQRREVINSILVGDFGEWRPGKCPNCGKESIYLPLMNRFYHDDLSVNGPCILATLRGQTPSDLAYKADMEAFRRQEDAFTAQVFQEYSRMRVRDEARAMLDRHKAADEEPFEVATLGELLERPPSPIDRVEGLIPWEGSTVIVAQRKTGKTTFVLNLVKSLLSGEDFLGRFPVQQVMGKVAFLSFEMGDDQLARWADEIGCPHDDLLVVSLRGRPTPFGNAEREAELGRMLRPLGVEVVIIDTFARAYPGESQNDPGQVAQFLSRIESFARQTVGASDVLLTVHAGWVGERSRGSSALEDWPDSIITLVKDDDDNRFMKAMGRDVDFDETRLEYDEDTHLLTLGEGSRKQASQERKMDELLGEVLGIVRDHPGLNGAEIERLMREEGIAFQKGDRNKVLKMAVDAGLLESEKGAGNSKVYQPPRIAPDSPTGAVENSPNPPIYRGGYSRGHSGRQQPQNIKTVKEICKPGIDQAVRRHGEISMDLYDADVLGASDE